MGVILAIAVLASIFMYGTYGQTKNTNPGIEQSRIDFSYPDITAMPKTTVYAELYCIGTFVASGNWTGVQLGYLLERAGVTQQAETLELYASDGYSTHSLHHSDPRGRDNCLRSQRQRALRGDALSDPRNKRRRLD